MLIRLAHVCINTPDLDASERFYQLLGAERRFEFRNLQEELIGMYMYFGENSFTELVKVRKHESTGSLAHFALEVSSVDEAYKELQTAGIEVSEKELGGDKTWMITCHDPNGVFIELHQYTEFSMQQQGGVCRIDYSP